MLLGIPAMTHRQCAEFTGDWSECVLCLEECVGEVRPLTGIYQLNMDNNPHM